MHLQRRALWHSILLFVVLWLLCFPLAKYYIDADGVGYLTITKRYASGDCFNAINGLWSPLSSWLLIPFFLDNKQAFTTALVINALWAILIIYLWFRLAVKLVMQDIVLYVITLALSAALVFYSYIQAFADLPSIACLLIFIHLQSASLASVYKTLLSGIIMALAFYSKAYCFPFFILLTVVQIVYAFRHKQALLLPQRIGSIIICLLLMLPWSMQLSKKYGGFNLTGNSGKLNMSWYVHRGKEFKPEYKLLIPPPYKNSPTYWEDPYFSQGKLHSPFESAEYLFIKWPLRIAHTCLMALWCYIEISIFLLPLLLYMLYCIFKNKNSQLHFISIVALTLPIGYLAMHIEARYIWLSGMLALIAAIFYIQNNIQLQQRLKVAVLLAISMIVFPTICLVQDAFKGRSYYLLAELFAKYNIHNSAFTAKVPEYDAMWAAAYLSNNQCYSIDKLSYDDQDLVDEVKRYSIPYFVLPNTDTNANKILLKELSAQYLDATSSYSLYRLTY